ncbi:MAG: tRNA lysidine(34) synthetase TilS [Leptospiraceae bacterium]
MKSLESWLIQEMKDGLVVAASGGPDSQLLLYLLSDLCRQMGLPAPSVFHFNHGLRQQADEDADLVSRTARQLDLSFFQEAQDVAGFARRMKMNLEAAARFLRYRDLFRASKLSQSGGCCTGHHGVDFAETALQRWIRSSGRELKDILPASSELPIWSSLRKSKRFLGYLKVIRPLLPLNRWDIEQLLEQHSIPFATDETNLDTQFQRNFIRTEIIPGLKQQGLNPASLWSVHHGAPGTVESKKKKPRNKSSQLEPFIRIPNTLLGRFELTDLATLIRLALKNLGQDMISRSMLHEIHEGLAGIRGENWLRVQNPVCEIWWAGSDLWIYPLQGEIWNEPVSMIENQLQDGAAQATDYHSRTERLRVLWLGRERIYDRSELEVKAARDVTAYRFQKENKIHTGKTKTLFQKESLPPPIRENLPILVDKQGFAVRACLSFLGQEDRIFFLA